MTSRHPGRPPGDREGCPSREACLDPGLLAGFVEGSLIRSEQERVEAHLAECDVCRSIVATMARGLDQEAATSTPSRRIRRLLPWAAAVVLLLGLAAILFGPLARREAETGALLASAAEALARERPDLFEGFAPLDAAERSASSPFERRGGVALLHPAPLEEVLSPRPTFLWRAEEGVDEWRVRLALGDGTLLWEAAARGGSHAYPSDRPPLEPGRKYSWGVSGQGPFGEVRDQQVFRAASEARREAFAAALAEIGRSAPRRIQALLAAHYALRRGFLAEAEREARAFLRAEPGDRVGRETLLQVLRRQGSPEAAGLEREPAEPPQRR